MTETQDVPPAAPALSLHLSDDGEYNLNGPGRQLGLGGLQELTIFPQRVPRPTVRVAGNPNSHVYPVCFNLCLADDTELIYGSRMEFVRTISLEENIGY